MTNTDLPAACRPASTEASEGARLGGRPYVVVGRQARRFPDLLAELTRTQPLTMLSVAFVAGLFFAWRR
jgi:hypothetical protein